MKIISKLYICDLDLEKHYDMPIGKRFIMNNKRYLAVPREELSCEDCTFHDNNDDECFYSNCSAYERLDRKDVSFKLVD